MVATMPGRDKVVNIPVVDNRIVTFAEKLQAFVDKEGQDIPLIAIVGALEVVKLVILDAVE